MSLNPRYVLAPNLQTYFVDRDTGLPLSGGLVFTYSDVNRTTPKEVFELQGNQANYTYAPLPNPIVLSAGGTMVDNNYNDIIPYWYPFDSEGNLELYYIVVQNSLGVDQFVRQAWPNAFEGSTPGGGGTGVINYIPNGQYREHINLPANTTPPYLLPAGITTIAQGGMYIRLDSGATSTNTFSYLTQPYTNDPNQSPRYVGNWICSNPNAVEVVKSHGVKFEDVNKFSAPPGEGGGPIGIWTYGFWAEATATVPFTIQVYKNFGTGGNPTVLPATVIATGEFTTTAQFFQFDIDFGSNAGTIIGTNNDDYVSIEISIPTGLFFNVQLADHTLVPFVDSLTEFPIQTDSDMMARGVFGWADEIDPAGSQLCLPPILTPYGMTWDTSQIGDVGTSLIPIPAPSTAFNNKMPCDGTTYVNSDYAPNGIPYSRLGNYLRASRPGNIPLFGTGPNFVTALDNVSGAQNANLRLTYNVAGTGSSLATEGSATGFAFANNFTFNGSTTGTVSFGYLASNVQNGNTILVATLVQNGTVQFTLLVDGNGGRNTNFTFLEANLTNFNGGSQTIACVSGEALVKAGEGRYFSVNITGGTQQNFWFNVDGANTAPTGLSGQLNEVKVSSSQTAADVANILREAMNGYNSTIIGCVASPPNLSYFLFYANPSSLHNFFVWYSYSASDVAPVVGGATGIRVNLTGTPGSGTPNATSVRNSTIVAINSYQYQAPAFQGMFARFADPNGIWDADSSLRWSYTPGVGGPAAGTYEYQQFLSHNHEWNYTKTQNTSFGAAQATVNRSGGLDTVVPTTYSGGNETRPTNIYLYPYVRY